MKKKIISCTILLSIACTIYCTENFYSKGIAAQKQKEHKKAIEYFSQAITNKTDSTKVYSKRGYSYFQLGLLNKAEVDFDKSIEKNVSKTFSYFNKALIAEKRNDYNTAIDYYLKVLEKDKSIFSVYELIGHNYSKLKNYKEAVNYYSKSLQINSENAGCYANRANAYDMLGDFKHAMSDYTESISINPNDPETYYNRGLTYYKNKKLKEAISDYSQAIN